jgi:hypothetical protein
MADTKISQLTPETHAMAATELFEVSIPDGSGGYDSFSKTGATIYNGVLDQTPYISAYSTASQTFLAGIPTNVIYDGTGFTNAISLHANEGLVVDDEGFYQVDFTATIFNNGAASSFNIGFYLTINGTDVADSSRFMNAPASNQYLSYQTSWLVNMAAADELVVVFVMEKANFELITESAFTGVLTPGAQVIMKRIG